MVIMCFLTKKLTSFHTMVLCNMPLNPDSGSMMEETSKGWEYLPHRPKTSCVVHWCNYFLPIPKNRQCTWWQVNWGYRCQSKRHPNCAFASSTASRPWWTTTSFHPFWTREYWPIHLIPMCACPWPKQTGWVSGSTISTLICWCFIISVTPTKLGCLLLLLFLLLLLLFIPVVATSPISTTLLVIIGNCCDCVRPLPPPFVLLLQWRWQSILLDAVQSVHDRCEKITQDHIEAKPGSIQVGLFGG